MRVLCHLFGIHRSVYYTQVKRPVNVQKIELRSRVRAFHALSRGAADSLAFSQMLRQSGVDAGRWLARRLMRECGLTGRQPVKHHYRVNEDKSPPLPNILNWQFNPAAPDAAGAATSVLFACRTNGVISRSLLIYIHVGLSVQPPINR